MKQKQNKIKIKNNCIPFTKIERNDMVVCNKNDTHTRDMDTCVDN